ncbi:unnamed protein product [Microthlaspi erraticum]|uniref:Retrotransposon gag domain-containing protein n=1 Tax=Microthlaspi erraticum TaxID=1685480 RepID=A0A6D2I5I8_9BRAS|nr:unnamed protein product [Microthlaspi erraticum]
MRLVGFDAIMDKEVQETQLLAEEGDGMEQLVAEEDLKQSSLYYGVEKEEGSSGVGEALLDQIKKMMAEEFDRRDQIKQAKGRRLGIRYISDGDKRNDPMASHGLGDDQAHVYYGSGHSSHSSRRRSRRPRDEPDRMTSTWTWEKKCEFNFNLHNIIGDNRVKLAVSEFNDYALRWWEQIILAREIGGAFEVTTWEEMKRIMRQRFVPGHYQRELHSKLRKLTQGSKSVEEYYQEMERRSSTRFNSEPRRPTFHRDTKSFAPKSETNLWLLIKTGAGLSALHQPEPVISSALGVKGLGIMPLIA